MPRIILGLNCCNRTCFLEEAISSMIAVEGVERFFIRCDGSPAEVEAIALGFASRDRVTVLSGPQIGLARSSNAIAVAAGDFDYIGFVDSDDLIATNAVLRCLSGFYQESARPIGAVYSQQFLIDSQGINHGVDPKNRIDLTLENFAGPGGRCLVMHFRLIRGEAFRALGGFRAWAAAADYEFFLRMLKDWDILHIPEPLYSYRIHPNRISVRSRSRQLDLIRQAKREFWHE